MTDWQLRLEHAIIDRDALVACGNAAPKQPDPPGGIYSVKPMMFNPSVYFAYIKEYGHTAIKYESCECRL